MASPAQTDYGQWPAEDSMLSVRSYSLTRKPLFAMLERAKQFYEQTQPQMVTIRVLDQRGSWRRVAYKNRRRLSSVIMDSAKREELLSDSKEFILSEKWYSQYLMPCIRNARVLKMPRLLRPAWYSLEAWLPPVRKSRNWEVQHKSVSDPIFLADTAIDSEVY